MKIVETSRIKMPSIDNCEYLMINRKFEFENEPKIQNQNELKEALNEKYGERNIKIDKTVLYGDNAFTWKCLSRMLLIENSYYKLHFNIPNQIY